MKLRKKLLSLFREKTHSYAVGMNHGQGSELVFRSISIELAIAPAVKRAVVDRLKLREVLKQLISNALESLPETGGRLGIFARIVSERELLIEITDNGTGIKKSMLDQIFNDAEIFPDDQQQRSQMGLKLTKTIIEQHGGKLSFRSEINYSS